ncbi:DNA-binding protein [Enterococcus faecalis]|nr:DNA-binding protein [Enterococcus faecalis]
MSGDTEKEVLGESVNEYLDILMKKIDTHLEDLLMYRHLPLVLTNENLKEEFQISDSTLNRLIKITDFPSCWYGIRGHYLRDDVLSWLEQKDYDFFIDTMKTLRSLE